MRVQLGVVLMAALAGACGDPGSNGDDSGGAAGTAGTSAGAGGSTAGAGGSKGGSGGATGGAGSAGSSGTSGASGSAVRGAVSLNILAPDGCSLTAQYQDFPKVDSGHPVTATEKGQGIAVGEMTEGFPAEVLC